MHAATRIFLLLLAVSLGASNALGEESAGGLRALSIDDVVSRSEIGGAPGMDTMAGPAISPDGAFAAYTVVTTGDSADASSQDFARTNAFQTLGFRRLWLYDVDRRTSRRLQGEHAAAWAPSWSPDGSKLAFFSDASGHVALWIWSRQRDELHEVSGVRPAMRILLDGIEWRSNSEVVICIADASREEAVIEVRAQGTVQRRVEYVWPKPNVANDVKAATILKDIVGQMALVGVDDGLVTPLTEPGELPIHTGLSPDGAWLAVSLLDTATSDKEINFGSACETRIVVFDLATRQRIEVTKRVLLYWTHSRFRWSPDSRQLAYFTTEGVGLTSRGEGRIFVWRADDRRVVQASPPDVRSFGLVMTSYPAWGSGDSLYAVAEGRIYAMHPEAGTHDVLALPEGFELAPGALVDVRYSGDAKSRPAFAAVARDEASQAVAILGYTDGKGWSRIWMGPHAYAMSLPNRTFSIARDTGAVVFVRESADSPPELWYAPKLGQAPIRLTNQNSYSGAIQLGRSQLLSFRNKDGDVIQIALLLPPDYVEGKRYPTVVTAYPSLDIAARVNKYGLDAVTGGFDLQLLATRGYVIAAIESPVTAGNPLRDIVGNVVPAVLHLIETGIAEPGRIGFIGHSQGGFAALALVTQSKLFAAVVSVCPYTVNFAASAGAIQDGKLFGTGLQERVGFKGNLWESPSEWIENSPYFYLDRVHTPVLVVTGGIDWPDVGASVYAGLSQLDRTVTFVNYLGEGHGPRYWAKDNFRDFLERSLAWLETYLKPGETK